MNVAEIADRVLRLALPHPVRVGVDGFCAAGKTTLADELARLVRARSRFVIRASADDFQNPPEIRYQLGKESPEGFLRHALDLAALRAELLDPLGDGGSLDYRTSTYDIHALKPNLSPQLRAPASAILILDGLFLHLPDLAGCFDFTIFVTASVETCLARALRRNQEGHASLEQLARIYRDRYIPGFQMYLDQVRPQDLASVVISTEGLEDGAAQPYIDEPWKPA